MKNFKYTLMTTQKATDMYLDARSRIEDGYILAKKHFERQKKPISRPDKWNTEKVYSSWRTSPNGSDSGYLLKLLGFEILLKCLWHFANYNQGNNDPPKKQYTNHAYHVLFQKLEENGDSEFESKIKDTLGPEYLKILKELGNNFVDVRYTWSLDYQPNWHAKELEELNKLFLEKVESYFP